MGVCDLKKGLQEVRTSRIAYESAIRESSCRTLLAGGGLEGLFEQSRWRWRPPDDPPWPYRSDLLGGKPRMQEDEPALLRRRTSSILRVPPILLLPVAINPKTLVLAVLLGQVWQPKGQGLASRRQAEVGFVSLNPENGLPFRGSIRMPSRAFF